MERDVAARLKEAEYLIIAAGAGFSADSGLPVYGDIANVAAYKEENLTYADLAVPDALLADPAQFYGFWGHCFNLYRETKSHVGYEILERWAALPNLKGVYVYTSNVDGHFRRFPLLSRRLNEIHGCVEEWMCPSCMGTFEENGVQHKREGGVWSSWHATPSDQCKESISVPPAAFRFDVDTDTMRLRDAPALEPGSSSAVPRCKTCALPCRPAVMLFHDTDMWLTEKQSQAGAVYQEWEAEMEADLQRTGGKLLILELGCGARVPTVRIECEEVLHDVGEQAHLVRINPEGPVGPQVTWMQSGARAALEAIDAFL